MRILCDARRADRGRLHSVWRATSRPRPIAFSVTMIEDEDGSSFSEKETNPWRITQKNSSARTKPSASSDFDASVYGEHLGTVPKGPNSLRGPITSLVDLCTRTKWKKLFSVSNPESALRTDRLHELPLVHTGPCMLMSLCSFDRQITSTRQLINSIVPCLKTNRLSRQRPSRNEEVRLGWRFAHCSWMARLSTATSSWHDQIQIEKCHWRQFSGAQNDLLLRQQW